MEDESSSYQSAVAFGVYWVAQVVQRHGLVALPHWYTRIAQAADDEEIVRLAEEASGLSITRAVTLTLPQSELHALCCTAWRDQCPKMLEEALEALNDSHVALDDVLNLQLTRVEIMLRSQQQPTGTDLAAIDMRLSAARQELPPARYWLMEARRALVDVKMAGSHFIKLAAAASRAAEAFGRALEQGADDAELQLHYGLYRYYAPAAQGGNRADGIRLLQGAGKAKSLRTLVAGILRDLGEAPCPEPNSDCSGTPPLGVLA